MKKKLMALFLSFAMLMSLLPATAMATEETYDGEDVSAEVIEEVSATEPVAKIGEQEYNDLHEAMVAAQSGETVLLIADVDLAGTEWEPVSFKGTFDGQNHVISNLTINKPGVSDTGFIASLNGTFKNVTFTNPSVIGGEDTGVLAGRAGGSAALAENITVNGTIKVETTHTGYARAGVIVGGWAYGNYQNITVDGGDKADSYIKHTGGGDGRYVAGIVGHADDVQSYVNCTVKNITISGGWLCGGIAGPGPGNSIASGCVVENVNIDAGYSGGMFGWYHGSGTVENSFVKNVAFIGDTTKNGAIGGYNANTSATVTNMTIKNVTNGGKDLLDIMAEVNGDYYGTLQAAIDNATSGQTITLLANVPLTETVIVNNSIALDLNGKKITSTAAVWAVKVESNSTLTLTDTSAEKNGTIEGNEGISVTKGSELIMEGGNIIAKAADGTAIQLFGSQATMKGGTITSENNGVKIFGDNATYSIFTMNDGEMNTKNASIAANGSTRYDNVKVTVKDGNITSGTAAIYWPANGELNIEGGELTGKTAVYFKSGSLNISGGTLNGNGEQASYVYKDSGFESTGDALVIENVGGTTGYEAIGTVSITSGTFTSVNADAIESYTAGNDGVNAVTGFITGGTFSSNPSDYLASGYVSVQDDDNNYVVCSDAVTGVTLDETTLSLVTGSTATLTATVEPVYALNKDVTWVSSDIAVATVEAGVVTAVAPGTATITVTTVDGGKTATCDVTVTASVVNVTGVTLDKNTVSLNPNGTATLVATVTPDNATDKTVTWTSSDDSVATVADGVVTAVAPGTATITVTTADGGKTATCVVTVETPMVPVEGMSLNRGSTTLTAIGATDTLIATITPANATNKTVIWTSSNPSVATVDQNGKVTAVSVGTAVITATAADDGPFGPFVLTCTVTVSVSSSSDSGSSSSGGSSVAPSAPVAPEAPKAPEVDVNSPTVDTETKADEATGSTTTTETKQDGTVVETTTNKDGSSTTTASKTETTTNKDGSTTTTTATNTSTTTATGDKVTEEKVEQKVENKDGSVTTTVGTKTETTTAAGDKVTEEKVEQKVENKDGSTTTTTATTATTTTADGKTASSETVEEKKENTDGSSTTTTNTTTKEADGTTTKSETVAETKVDETGKETTTSKNETTSSNGSKSTTTVDETGKVESEVTVSSKAVTDAAKAEGAVTLPMPEVSATTDTDTAPTVEVSLPSSAKETKVEIPVVNPTAGTVVVVVNPDGTEEILKDTVVTENGVAATLNGDATLKVVDNSQDFDDVESHDWFNDASQFVSSREIMSGTSETTFAPETESSRGMIAVILHSLENDPEHSNTHSFDDVGDTWYTDSVKWAAESGIMSGTGDGKFGADDAVTREQLAVTLFAYANKKGLDTTADSSLDAFGDAENASDWAKAALEWAVHVGLLSGKGDGLLDPTGTASRAEIAQILMAFCSKVAK